MPENTGIKSDQPALPPPVLTTSQMLSLETSHCWGRETCTHAAQEVCVLGPGLRADTSEEAKPELSPKRW